MTSTTSSAGRPLVPWARAAAAGIAAAGVDVAVYVPDNPLSHLLCALGEGYPAIRTLIAMREEEAVGIAAGLYLGGSRPVVMMQSSGVGNAINAVGSLLLPYQIPVLLIISMRGDPGEWNAAQVPVGRAIPALLDALGIQHVTAERSETVADDVALAGRLAFGVRAPAACLLPRRLTAAQP